MRVVIAPDSFKGTLTASEAAAAIAAGWEADRPGDELVVVPMSDGGDGLLDVVARSDDRPVTVEVADPLGHPRQARLLLRGRTAVIASEEACGLRLVAPAHRNPLHTTTYGVGQLLEAARAADADRIVVGLGGSATVDGGAGALTALGFRVTVADGSGLKVGGGQLHRVARVEPRWVDPWDGIDVELLADVRTPLLDAPRRFGPQKGASQADLPVLEQGVRRWADVVEGDLDVSLRHHAGTGAAGGLGFGLAAGLGARIVPGAERVAELAGLTQQFEDTDLLVVGEGELDETSFEGKVVGTLAAQAREHGIPVVAVVGRVSGGSDWLDRVETAGSAEDDPAAASRAVTEAAARLAGHVA